MEKRKKRKKEERKKEDDIHTDHLHQALFLAEMNFFLLPKQPLLSYPDLC